MDIENLEMPAGATWQLEYFFIEQGDSRNTLLNDFATAIEKNHPRLKIPFPRGWPVQ